MLLFFYKLTNYAACSHKHVFWIINIRRLSTMRQAGSVWQIGVRFILVVWFRMTAAAAAARFFLEGVYINAIINCLLDEGSLRREPAGVIISTRGRRNKWGKVSSGWRNFLCLLHRRCHLAVKKSGFLFDSMSFRYDKETTITWKTRKNFFQIKLILEFWMKICRVQPSVTSLLWIQLKLCLKEQLAFLSFNHSDWNGCNNTNKRRHFIK